MTPKSDHEEDMSMEEILASIRKFVTDNPPENPNKQRVYKGDLAESVVIPPAGHARGREDRPQSAPNLQPEVSPGYELENESHPQPTSLRQESYPTAYEAKNEDHYQRPTTNRQPPPTMPMYEPEILELKSPILPTGSIPNHLPDWTPPSRMPMNKKILEESIMTLTNPIDSKKTEKLSRAPIKPSSPAETEEGLGSSHALAASASSLSRLAQASKSMPKRTPSLADQRNVTLDQLIQDLIRPMIKQWIDTHLPSLVEEMVAKEIKRITKHLG